MLTRVLEDWDEHAHPIEKAVVEQTQACTYQATCATHKQLRAITSLRVRCIMMSWNPDLHSCPFYITY
jgi:hypothetical protein